ncbi:hypothetical protein HAX54_028918 [Datura stramonium]|uniref:BUD13 homolog n=1 Tax=Datura stramonium TaxID=4076 RepID=A0ABS8V5E6_DATST|nr:hypothetical protein [Datura stramonium]
MVAPSSTSTSLKEYLKKYESNNNEEEKKKQKKKKKVKPNVKGVVVVDEDPVWQKPVKIEDEEDESAGEELPQVNEDIEVKRMKRLEQIRARRPFGSVSEDGSGWVSVSSTSNNIISDDQISDLSPPRKRLGRNDSPSPEPQLNRSSPAAGDLSPPRKSRARNDTPSPESGPKQPRTQKGDLSPPRKRSARNDTQRTRIHTPSPEPQLKPSSAKDADMSPPRKRRVRNDTPELEMKPLSNRDVDISPPRRRRARNDTPEFDMKSLSSKDVDISPPRRRRTRNDTPSPEPQARPSTDLSPPRRRQMYGQSLPDISDVSPPRRGSRAQGDLRADQATDISSSRKKKDQNALDVLSSKKSSDFSAIGTASDSDLSPRRKARPDSSTMKQGPKTGLVSGKDIKEEIDRTKKEDWLRFQEMDPLVSGRDAEPVYRDKYTGQQMSKEEFLKSKKKKEEKEKPKEIKLEWGKGLAQKREMEVRLQELESEKDKPFARSRDDPELDTMLKERVRWGDPMAHLVKKKQFDPILPDLGANEKMKDSGFIIPQEIPSHSWIKRGLDAAPNRYGIRPGRHWDGVDRSTGYEKELFKRTNEKRATEREAYLWSVSDM